MTKVKDIAAYYSEKIPAEMKMDFDNVGLLVGLCERNVTRALFSLDITDEVISEAVSIGAQLIVSHHPLFFSLKRVANDDADSAKAVKLLQNGISAICLHTNFDSVDGGVNDALAQALGVNVQGRLENLSTLGGLEHGIGRFGRLEAPMALSDFLSFAKSALNANGLRYHDAGRMVCKVALCGGSGGEYIARAAELGCDTIVTADIKYHQLLLAKELCINAVDADHFCTENVAVPILADMLKAAFPDVETHITSLHMQTAKFF